jgi:hypothetical protein
MPISRIETDSLAASLVAPSATTATTATTATALTTASGSAPSYSARAWVNFDGSGTVTIRSSGNVSSITDNGVGDYTINFVVAMADANYSFCIGNNNYNQIYPRATGLFGETPATGGIRLKQAYTVTFGSAQTFEDTAYFTVTVFR